ncbi:hypothetical protein [Streptomyces sp. NPDC057877]|uniref:hypothetical protein n=1 Tax=Streptomyces sp. NPDC057877 TaxID=3346269 RepID=UPI00369E06A9
MATRIRVRAAYAPTWTSPAAARRRMRRGVAVALALVVSPYAALAVGPVPGGVAIALVLTAGPGGLLLLGELHTERPPRSRSGPLLTARTTTGERTLDLDRIERVRLLTYFSRSGVSERVLLVRDTEGTWLGLTGAASRRTLRRALERPSRRGARPRVSRAARVHLGMAPGRLAVHTGTVWLATVFGVCCYAGAVLALADGRR